MKYIRNFKLFETGEWPRDVDLDYCEENPDDDCEECNWIRELKNQLEYIIDNLENKDIFKIIDIRGFDQYQGPYAIVKIFDNRFEIWTSESEELIINNFYINNNDYEDNFIGNAKIIYEIINDIYSAGGPNVYKNAKKYNI